MNELVREAVEKLGAFDPIGSEKDIWGVGVEEWYCRYVNKLPDCETYWGDESFYNNPCYRIMQSY